MASLGFDLGWFGFGYEGGLLPNIRIGALRVWWCRGSLFERVTRLKEALTAALKELQDKQSPSDGSAS